MSWPSKILPFRKLDRPPVIDATTFNPDRFPRFRGEQMRVPLTGRPLVVGFGIPPVTPK